MFPMSITIASRAELQAVMAALADTNAYAQAKGIHTDPKPALPEGDIRVAMGKPAGTARPAPAPATNPAAEEPPVDYETVKVHILTLSKKRGTQAALQLLEQFGVKKAPDLRPDQYREVLTAAAKALADQEAA